jgi:5-methylcytosine-specific restriction endonuclease McrA
VSVTFWAFMNIQAHTIISSNNLKTPATCSTTSRGMTNIFLGDADMFSITKKCTKCGETKPVSEFHKSYTEKSGLMTQCKSCKLLYAAEYRKRNMPSLVQKAMEWAHQNRERVREVQSAHRERNRDKEKERHRKYDQENPDKVLEKLHRRIAKKHNVVGGHFTEKEWREVLDMYGHKCLCCGRSGVPLERDHVIPIGPPHSDEITNIQPLCRSCNARKGNRTIDYR